MGPNKGMLPVSGVPGIDMRDPRVRAAVISLRNKGVPLNKVNIAEEMAVMGGQGAAPTHVMPDGTIMPGATHPAAGRGGPSSGIVQGIEAREAAALAERQAEQLRIMREAQAAARAKRGMLPVPAR